jgi:hypothetical protein
MQRRLSAVARRSIAEFAHEVGYYQPMNEYRLGADFYKLAMEINMCVLLPLMDMLHVFFEPAAAKLLLRLPNRYWFWITVQGAIVRAGVRDANKPIPQIFVAEKLAEIHRIYASKYNLQLALSDLSPSQVASRAVAGVLLVHARPSDLDEIVLNPIFSPGLDIKGSFADLADELTAILLKEQCSNG